MRPLALLLLLTAPVLASNYGDWGGVILAGFGVVCGIPSFLTLLVCYLAYGRRRRFAFLSGLAAWLLGLFLTVWSVFGVPFINEAVNAAWRESVGGGATMLALYNCFLTAAIFVGLVRLTGPSVDRTTRLFDNQ